MARRVCIVVVGLVLTVLAVAAVAGHHRYAGRTLYSITENHGIDAGDVPIGLAWLVAMWCLVKLWPRG